MKVITKFALVHRYALFVCRYILLILLVSPLTILGQTSNLYYPKIGDKIPDYTFSDVVNNRNSNISISEYRGKWVIIDFWTSICGGCLASFDRMNSLQNKFRYSLKLIMVGLTHENGAIQQTAQSTKSIYRKMEKKFRLNFTVAFDHSSGEVFNVGGVPMILVVNPMGVIVAKTNYIDSIQFANLLRGGLPTFNYAYSRDEPAKGTSYDLNVPMLASEKNSENEQLISRWHARGPHLWV
jgi:peroxiredoxin